MRTFLRARRRELDLAGRHLFKIWCWLWSHRRFRWSVMLATGTTLLLAITYTALSLAVASRLVHAERIQPQTTPADWGLNYEDVRLRARDGLMLDGWMVQPLQPQPRRRLIIVVHDTNSGRADPSVETLVHGLAGAGFAVLAYDGRGHGTSEGDHYGLSVEERYDLLGALDFAGQQGYHAQSIGVVGLGTGGATALLTAAESDGMGAFVVDSAYASLADAVRERLQRNRLPGPLFWGIRKAIELRYGPDIDHILPEAAIARMQPRPVLIIHGENDQIFSADHARRLAQAAGPGGHTELWIVEDTNHLRAIVIDPERYLRRVINFFDGALL